MTGPAAPIDLRSDTVTKPSADMRRAIADAAVGDDVFGEDPSVNRLQDMVADVLGKEAALFVPTGCMGNQIAIAVHTTPGTEVIVGRGAHSMLFETGAAAAVSGVQMCAVPGDGRFDADAVRAAFKADNHHYAPTSLVCVENTHNMGGGLVWDKASLDAVVDAARDLGMPTHLDGARLWNAAAASGISERDWAAGFDTVMVCLSKGLGAPVGSVIAGTAAAMHKAHKVRKMLGGGMRQAGILAAACIHALDNNRDRLTDDHDNAMFLAKGVNAIDGLSVDVDSVHTNIVMVDVDPARGTAPALAASATERGLVFVALGPTRLRLVTHLDVDRDACARAVEILAAA
jgi:threonine aldolase